MARMRRVLPLAVVTLFIWGVRLRNVIEDEGLGSFGGVVTIAFLVIGLGLLAVGLTPKLRMNLPMMTFAKAAAVFTVGWWIVRMIGILVDRSHSVGFIVVHAVLAGASIGAAVWLLVFRSQESGRGQLTKGLLR